MRSLPTQRGVHSHRGGACFGYSSRSQTGDERWRGVAQAAGGIGIIAGTAAGVRAGVSPAKGAAPIAGKIEGFTKHGLDQAITRGVKPGSILNAVKNPLKVKDIVTDTLGRQSQRYIGREAEVVLNPQTGQIISVNPTSSAKAARLLGE